MRSQIEKIDLDQAADAAAKFRQLSLAKVRRIVNAVAERAEELAEDLAIRAVEETGFGVVTDKIQKNLEFSKGFISRYSHEDYVSHRVDEQAGLLLTPKPAGVVFALTPSTNPVATVYYKVLSALITRNAIVVSPHPGAKNTCIRAVEELRKVAEQEGLPSGALQIVKQPSVELVEELMRHEKVSLILATGGGAMVKAAYQSGTPAIGVGPGNAPAVVDDSADIAKTADAIMDSKTFDNSVLCTAESGIIVTQMAASKLLRALEKLGAWVCSSSQKAQLAKYMYPKGQLNPGVVGKSASEIAQQAGFAVDKDTKILVVPIDEIDEAEPFTHEKLSPVISWRVVTNFTTAVKEAVQYLNISGQGHSAVIHSEISQHVLDYSEALPVHRITVNAPGSTGNAGIGTNLPATMSVGTGFVGGSATDTNFTPDQLVQWCRTTYLTAANTRLSKFETLEPQIREPNKLADPRSDSVDSVLLRRMILEELESLLGEVRRG